jgi:hypothetical protein
MSSNRFEGAVRRSDRFPDGTAPPPDPGLPAERERVLDAGVAEIRHHGELRWDHSEIR